MTGEPTPLDRLRLMMDEDPLLPGSDDAMPSTATDDVISSALELVGLNVLTADAQELLLAVNGSAASLEPAARARMVAAAERALKTRRDAVSPLPRLLFLRRHAAGENVDALAGELSVDAKVLGDVERGRDVLETLPAEVVATWVRHFDVPTIEAREALVKALRLQGAGDRAAASGMGMIEVEESAFFLRIMELLEPSDS